MPNYIVDPSRFHAEGAVVNWSAAAKRLGLPDPGGPTGAQLTTVELRWMVAASMGLPTEPFQVWARAHGAQSVLKTLSLKQQTFLFAFNNLVVTWSEGSMSTVSATIQAAVAGSVFAFAGAPLLSNIVTFAAIPVGTTVVSLAANIIEGLIFTPGITVTAVVGVETGGLSQAAGWTPIELVGLPVQQAAWTGIGKHGEPEGMTGAFTDAVTAAVARLRRAAPPIGWASTLATGVAAPGWAAPDSLKLVEEANARLLEVLKPVVAGFAPNQQGGQKVTVALPPPQNSSGESMTVAGSTSQVSPLSMLLMAASADPFLNLALGFGTGYPAGSDFGPVSRVRLDYMVTAHYEKGLDGVSVPADFAAIVALPGLALPPGPPANMVTPLLGMLRPLATDGPWRASTRVSWDRPLDSQMIRSVSFAFARAGVTPSAAAVALMEKRASGGYRPLVINNAVVKPPAAPEPEGWRLHAVDQELEIPTNPGNSVVKYASAIQDIYGQWTPWTSADATLQQPALDQVRIAKASLVASLPGVGTVCPGRLEVEFLWDWRIRRLQQVSFVGVLYAAATAGDPPPSLALPAGLSRSIGGAEAAFVLNFNGADAPSFAGVIALNEAGDAQVAFGAAQGFNRRFRLTVPGFSLDFGPTGHVGLALWTQGQEHIAPQRFSAWSSNPPEHPSAPTVVSASDPRPPVVPTEHVTLASLPDANGQSHSQLRWTAQGNANGYFIYEANETTLLQFYGLPQATPAQTLDQRLTILKNHFDQHPERTTATPFTRMNATLLRGTSTDVLLPRGSTGIHVYIVLGVSAGGVEGEWPKVAAPPDGTKPSDRMAAIAAPHIMQPAAPTIEVTRFFDAAAVPPAFKAALTIRTRPGPRPVRLDLHRVRVDDAAKELDTMGPAVGELSLGAPLGWALTAAVDGGGASYIATAAGTDAPGGSWRRVWYRATAWTGQDATRGGLPGRSPASNAAWVVLPPGEAPVVSPLGFGAGPTAADFVAEWSSAAPVKKTPLGPHRLAVRAVVAGAPAKTKPLLAFDGPLDTVGTTAPATGSGVWVVSAPGVSPVVYRALVRRAAVTDVVKFAVRVTDPIARTGEQLATVGAGPINPAPDLSELDVETLIGPPPRVLMTFTSGVPLTGLDGPYMIHVVATFKRTVILLPAPVRSLNVAAGSVLTVLPKMGIAPSLALMRSPGPGPVYTYTALCFGAAVNFVVSITAPDGRVVQKTKVVV